MTRRSERPTAGVHATVLVVDDEADISKATTPITRIAIPNLFFMRAIRKTRLLNSTD